MGSPALAVACVLKTGAWHNGLHRSEYRVEHVRWLKRQVARHLTLPHRFVCLSNVEIDGVETIPLTEGWPGWWNKIELFRHDLGRVLYFDLDTVIVGSLDEMAAHEHQFTALQALSKNQGRCLNSGLMAWQGPRLDVFEAFRDDAARHMRDCRVRGNWGDQGFLNRHVGHWDAWQEMFPGRVVSYKLHLKQRLPPPAGVSVVCFHGKPRPWEVNHSWVPR
jgi:hypothetical protein